MVEGSGTLGDRVEIAFVALAVVVVVEVKTV